MFVFMPHPEFYKSAQVLDNRRLGLARVNAWRILRDLRGEDKNGYSTSPSVNMWRTHEGALAWYGMQLCEEWISRGYKDNMYDKFEAMFDEYKERRRSGDNRITVPSWLGNEDIHASHRSNLLRRNKKWYSQFNWEEENDLPFIWPDYVKYNY